MPDNDITKEQIAETLLTLTNEAAKGQLLLKQPTLAIPAGEDRNQLRSLAHTILYASVMDDMDTLGDTISQALKFAYYLRDN